MALEAAHLLYQREQCVSEDTDISATCAGEESGRGSRRRRMPAAT
jgi:hypothetical protein